MLKPRCLSLSFQDHSSRQIYPPRSFFLPLSSPGKQETADVQFKDCIELSFTRIPSLHHTQRTKRHGGDIETMKTKYTMARA